MADNVLHHCKPCGVQEVQQRYASSCWHCGGVMNSGPEPRDDPDWVGNHASRIGESTFHLVDPAETFRL